MARRRKKRLSGFGSDRPTHARYAKAEARDAQHALRAARGALAVNDCHDALGWLVSASGWHGRALAHGETSPTGRDRWRPNVRTSGGLKALQSVQQKFYTQCVKRRVP